jgi:1-acyl-sn-glycerol-3-phosphate acyltransferase
VHRPLWRRLIFLGCWGIGWVVLTLTCRIRIEGDVPKGPAILVSNHPSYLDGPLAFYLSTRVRVVAKLNPHRVIRAAYYLVDAFITGGGASEDATRHVRAGGIVWIVPGGRLSSSLPSRAHRGAARIASETGAPVLPAAMIGTADVRLREWRPWRRPQVRIVLGTPRYVPPGKDWDEVMDELMRELSRLTDAPYQPG